jgi:hypothetical protein
MTEQTTLKPSVSTWNRSMEFVAKGSTLEWTSVAIKDP